MQRIVIPNAIVGGTQIDKLNIFLDDHGNLIFLPFLWAFHLSNTSSVFLWIKRGNFNNFSKFHAKKQSIVEKVLDLQSVTQNTIDNYLGHVFKLLQYINKLNISSNTPSVHKTELLNSRILNSYFNVELPKSLKSYSSLNAHKAAVNAYLNFLFELEIKDITPITIYKKTKQLMAEKDTRLKKINYISKTERSNLLKACNCVRDKLIIRLGYEVGLRTSELRGLLLRKKNEKNTPSKKGLLNLFFDLDHNKEKMSFSYLLDGKFAKRGKSRNIYFSRELLQSMKDYYENERLIVEKQSKRPSDTLLLRLDPSGIGLPISKNQGSNTFRKLLKQFPYMNETLSYHDLRHTFATELYHEELLDKNGQETRSESAALLTVSQRLGHQNTETSRIYIRLRQQMVIIEEAQYDR